MLNLHLHSKMLRSKLLCITKENVINEAIEENWSKEFKGSKNIFEISKAIGYPEVLSVPFNATTTTSELIKLSSGNQSGHWFFGNADAVTLIACTENRPLIITDTFPVRIEALRLALRWAWTTKNFALWKIFMKNGFPHAFKYIDSILNEDKFNIMLDNIYDKKIIITNSDLSKPGAHTAILNYLKNETENPSITFVFTTDQENNITKRVVAKEMEQSSSMDDDSFAADKQSILEQLQSSLDHYQENVKALLQPDTLLIQSNDKNEIQLFDKLQVESDWKIRSSSSLELITRDANHAEILAETFYMAQELQNAYLDIIKSSGGKITTNHVPAFDTLVESGNQGSEKRWKLSFIDSTNLEHPTITVGTKASIFKRVSNFVKMSTNHITTVGSSALNLFFGVQAICHWIDNGFRPQTQGISNESLATAIEVHFYVNAVGLIQGLGETVMLAGAVSLTQGIKSALLINALKPYVQMSMKLFRASTTGRFLLSMGSFTSKALPIIGLILNAGDLGLNIYELFHNDDPHQRPKLITNTVFSAAGLTISISATVAAFLGAAAIATPLAVIGLGIAIIYIPVAYLVDLFTDRIEGARHTGLMIKSIIEEIKQGAYRKVTEYKFLTAPSFVPVKELKLSSTALKVTIGKNDYQRKSGWNKSFTHWYHAEEEFADKDDRNCASISIDDDEIRAVFMPHIPGYTFRMSEETVSFSAGRHDAEFKMAQELQIKDPEFEFQRGEWRFWDQIADKFSFDYEHTNIDINIEESNWKLIFPWQDLSHATNDEQRNLLKQSNEEIANHLEKISYHLNGKMSGRQTILLPALQCPVDMHLNSLHDDAIWFIEFIERSVSNKEITISNDGLNIKIGEKQNIYVNRKMSSIYINVPKYQNSENNYNGMAFFDFKENHYIYNKDATEAEQKIANLLFATKEFAYFYLHDQSSADNLTGTVWCVSMLTHKLIVTHNGIKICQKQGNGLVLVNDIGIIYHIHQDLRTHGIVSQVIGFTDTWFNQRKNPKKALEDINLYLKKNPYNTIIHLYLPYQIGDETASKTCNILFYPKNEKYFILDSKYVQNSNQPKFVKFDKFDKNAYYYDDAQKNLMIVKGINMDETSRKLEIIHDKTVVNINEQCDVLLKGVLSTLANGNGCEARLACGLVVHIYKSQANHMKLTIQKLILVADFESQHDKMIENFFQKTIEILKNEHLGDNIKDKIPIQQPTFVSIIHMGKIIGFYETMQRRALSIAKLPKAFSVRPLGSDNQYAYHILDNKKMYQSQWVIHLSEIRNGPKNHVTPTKLFFEADTMELFDETLFLKKDKFDENFSNTLKLISNLPEIDLIWLESKNYTLQLDHFENVSISSIDLSESTIDINIIIQMKIKNANEDYYFERQNFDLYLCCPQQKFSFIFKGVFKSKTITAFLEGVTISTKTFIENLSNIRTLPNIIKIYNENTDIIYTSYREFYAKLSLMDILKRDELPTTRKELENIFKYLLWPNQNDEQKICETIEWTIKHESSRPSIYLLNLFKEVDEDILTNLLRKTKQLNILHLAAKNGRYVTIQAIFKCLHLIKNRETMAKFILMTNEEGNTFLHLAVCSNESHTIRISLLEAIYRLDESDATQLVLETNNNGENVLHYLISNNKINSNLLSLTSAVREYFGVYTLKEMMTASFGYYDKNILHIPIENGNIENIPILFEHVINWIGLDNLKTLLTQQGTEGTYYDILQFTVMHGKPEAIPVLFDEIKKHCGVDFLDNLVQAVYENGHDILDLAISYTKLKIIPNLLKAIHTHLNINVLKQFLFKKYEDDVNVIFDAAVADDPEIIPLIFHEVKMYLGASTLEKLILEKDSADENILQTIIYNDRNKNIPILFKEIKEYFGVHILKHLVLEKTEDVDKNILQYTILNDKPDAIEILLKEVKNYLGNDFLKDVMHSIDFELLTEKFKNIMQQFY